jgi:hypothetical protein
VRDWLTAYNFAKQLKALRFKTPYTAIDELWESKPEIFNVRPNHHSLGLNSLVGFEPLCSSNNRRNLDFTQSV